MRLFFILLFLNFFILNQSLKADGATETVDSGGAPFGSEPGPSDAGPGAGTGQGQFDISTTDEWKGNQQLISDQAILNQQTGTLGISPNSDVVRNEQNQINNEMLKNLSKLRLLADNGYISEKQYNDHAYKLASQYQLSVDDLFKQLKEFQNRKDIPGDAFYVGKGADLESRPPPLSPDQLKTTTGNLIPDQQNPQAFRDAFGSNLQGSSLPPLTQSPIGRPNLAVDEQAPNNSSNQVVNLSLPTSNPKEETAKEDLKLSLNEKTKSQLEKGSKVIPRGLSSIPTELNNKDSTIDPIKQTAGKLALNDNQIDQLLHSNKSNPQTGSTAPAGNSAPSTATKGELGHTFTEIKDVLREFGHRLNSSFEALSSWIKPPTLPNGSEERAISSYLPPSAEKGAPEPFLNYLLVFGAMIFIVTALRIITKKAHEPLIAETSIAYGLYSSGMGIVRRRFRKSQRPSSRPIEIKPQEKFLRATSTFNFEQEPNNQGEAKRLPSPTQKLTSVALREVTKTITLPEPGLEMTGSHTGSHNHVCITFTVKNGEETEYKITLGAQPKSNDRKQRSFNRKYSYISPFKSGFAPNSISFCPDSVSSWVEYAVIKKESILPGYLLPEEYVMDNNPNAIFILKSDGKWVRTTQELSFKLNVEFLSGFEENEH